MKRLVEYRYEHYGSDTLKANAGSIKEAAAKTGIIYSTARGILRRYISNGYKLREPGEPTG